jgi:uncharacterized integral membrane protein
MTSQERVLGGRTPTQRVRLGAGIGGVGLLVLFFLQNLQDVELNLLWFTWNTSMVWALLLAAALGAGAMFFFTTVRRRSRATSD